MSGRYLTDLASVLRGAGLAVVEYGGWQTRARSSGGYASGRPTHVMCHHDASSPSSTPEGLANYSTSGSDAAPVSNLHLMRDATWWVLAAGATNTNGSGHDWWGGGVPDDSMNTHAIGIEAANNGVGEPWPDAQQDAYLRGVIALRSAYGIPANNVRAHFCWAPDRKIDPSGPSRWAPHPSGGGGSNMWNFDAFRADTTTGPPPVPMEETGMLTMFTIRDAKQPSWCYVTNGLQYRLLADQATIDMMTVWMHQAGLDPTIGQISVAQVGAAGQFIDASPPNPGV